MKQAARRQILEDLGIAAWRLRVAERVVPAAPAVDAPEPDVPEPDQPLEPMPRAEQTPMAAATPAQERSAPWTALSLALPGVVLLVDGADSRRDLRLAMDVLAAAAGDWQAKPVSRRFDWPPATSAAAVATDAAAGRRALAAFVDKDLADHHAGLLLCVAALAERLPEGEPARSRRVIPDLDDLGREAAAKRDLWDALQSVRG